MKQKKWLITSAVAIGVVLLCILVVIVVRSHDENRRLVDANNHLVDVIDGLEEEAALSEIESESLQKELDDLEAEVSRLEGEMNEVDDLREEITDLENSISWLEHRLNLLENMNIDYLSYITIDEGYGLVGYVHQIGTQFDFHIYSLRLYSDPEAHPEGMLSNQAEIVVVKDDEVLGTISSDSWPLSSALLHSENPIIEFPSHFGGYNGIIIRSNHIGMWEYLELYLERDGELIYVSNFSNIANPSFDFERQEIRGVSLHYPTYALSVYHLIDGELMRTERLILDSEERIAQIYIDGQWQTQEYDEARWDREMRFHWSNYGLFYSY